VNQQEIEIIGILSSAIVLISMLAKTMSYRGTMFMRVVNTFGCFTFIIYGFLLSPSSLSIIIMNAVICIVNVFYIIREYKNHHKNKI